MVRYSEGELIDLTKDFFTNRPEILFTRGGTPVVLFTSSGGGDFPLVGAYFSGECWIPCAWLPDGAYGSINEHMTSTSLDLIINQEDIFA